MLIVRVNRAHTNMLSNSLKCYFILTAISNHSIGQPHHRNIVHIHYIFLYSYSYEVHRLNGGVLQVLQSVIYYASHITIACFGLVYYTERCKVSLRGA